MTVMKELLDCIPPMCVSTDSNKGLETMYFTNNTNNLSDHPILHIKKTGILDLETIESNVKDKQFKMIHAENEWIIFKPKTAPVQ